MNPQSPRAFVTELKDQVINRHDPAAASRFFAADFETLNPIPGRERGLAGLQAALKEFFNAFPDVHETLLDVTGIGNTISLVAQIEATHAGEFMAVQATHRRVKFFIFEFYHLDEGKVRRAWVFFDAAGFLKQVQLDPTPTEVG